MADPTLPPEGGAAAPVSATAEGARPVDVSEEEVDALLAEGHAAGNIRPDVPRPYSLAAGAAARHRAPVLDRIHERWIGALGQRLGALVRQDLDITLGGVELMPYADWQAALPAPSSVDVYTIEPWAKSAIVAVEGELLFVLVDACYGGSGRPAPGARSELTPAEQHIKGVAVRALIEEMQRAFEPVAALEFRHERSEIGARHVAIATPSETVVATRVDLQLMGVGGAVHVVIPLSAFDSVADELAEGLKGVSAETRKRWRGALEARLDETKLELACVFLTTQLTVRELLKLRPGDILPIEMPRTASLNAGTKPLLIGKFGQSRGYNAVRIIGAVEQGSKAAAEEGKEA